MNRVRDYTGFVAWFSGVGYIVLWPLATPDLSGKPFGASIICSDGSFSALHLFCNSAHPLQLPPGLHVIGLFSAIFVAIRLLYFAFKRTRHAVGSGASATSAVATTIPPGPPESRRRLQFRPVKPRSHFGLRGTPR